ncbi:MAG: hypothetical protein GQ477_06035 [Nanohaloarchaea archaeon]|nr:hypothetical protein [Candidatus Nanohaloarchaea archaeon]
MIKKKESIMANSKAFVIVIALLFASSTLGAVFLQAPEQNGADIPEDQILKEPLTAQQEAILLQNYRVIVYASAPDASFLINDLEMLMNSFPEVAVEDGAGYFVYLVEDVGLSDSIIIKAISNETDFDSYVEEDVVSFICDNSHPYIASQYMICTINDM